MQCGVRCVLSGAASPVVRTTEFYYLPTHLPPCGVTHSLAVDTREHLAAQRTLWVADGSAPVAADLPRSDLLPRRGEAPNRQPAALPIPARNDEAAAKGGGAARHPRAGVSGEEQGLLVHVPDLQPATHRRVWLRPMGARHQRQSIYILSFVIFI